jgi:hypothetical protein
MRRSITWLSLAVALAVVVAASAADKKDKAEPKDKLVSAGEFEGTLTQLDSTSKWFTVEVTQKIRYENQGAKQNIANLLVQRAQASQNRNLVDRARQLQSIDLEIAKNQQNLIGTKDQKYTFELQAADEMKVRQAHPPVQFDDKGKPKRYTTKELAELKGPNKKLPGYTADFDNLHTGQKVKVYLAKKKSTVKSAPKDADKDSAPDKRLSVVMIVILQEAPK